MTQTIRNPVRWLDIQRDMTSAELFFASCLSRGDRCRLGGVVPGAESDKNSIRAEVIRFFAYSGDENHQILGSEILLRGGWIKGDLNLSFARVPYALSFYQCRFEGVVKVIRTKCPAFYLAKSHLSKGLKGDGLKTSGGVFMRKGFSAAGKVSLLGADIGGNLNCIGGQFADPGNEALLVSHAKIGGGVFLSRGFSAKGAVHMIGTNVGGSLKCSGGEFRNKDGNAINASQAKIGKDVLLDKGFLAEGEVRLLGASIGGQLDCAGGRFNNQGDQGWHGQRIYALNAERAKTGGHVYLNQHKSRSKEPFTADGRVRFANANIGGNFNCKGGQFNHSGERSALAAGGLRSRAVFLSEGFSAKGEVALHVAHIGNFVCTGCEPNGKIPTTINLSSTKSAAVDDDEDSWKQFEFILDGFTYDTFYGHSPTDSDTRLKWLAKRPEKRRLKNGEMAALSFSPLPYEQAAKVLFGMGRSSDARKILLEKERRQTDDNRTPWWQKIGRKLWDGFSGYGYQAGLTVWWSLAIIAIGWLVFSHAANIGRIVPHQPAIIAKMEHSQMSPNGGFNMVCFHEEFPEYPKFNPLVFSADVFIPVFALHQEPFWSPVAGNGAAIWWLLSLLVALVIRLSLHPRRLELHVAIALCLCLLGVASPKHWYWLEIGFGWLLTSLFLLSVTGLLRPRQSSGGKD